MKQIDEMDLMLCRIQAKIFEASVKMTECSSAVFLRRFMNSQVATRFDVGSFLFEASSTQKIFEEIDEEFGHSSYGKEKYAAEEMYWIGYIYRYWCCAYGKTSKQVYKIAKPKELRAVYFPYHSLDPAQAIERILEAKDIVEEDYTEKGVKILREIIRCKDK